MVVLKDALVGVGAAWIRVEKLRRAVVERKT